MTLPRNFVILANKIWCGFKIICSIRNYWPENWRKKGNWQTEIVHNRLKVNKIVSTVAMVGIAKLFCQACSFVRLSGSITRPPCQCACLRILGLFCLGANHVCDDTNFLKFMWQSTWNTVVFVAPRWVSKHFFYKSKFVLSWCSLLNSASWQFTLDLASPQTSFAVRLSRIHFGEMNAWQTNHKGRLRGGYTGPDPTEKGLQSKG